VKNGLKQRQRTRSWGSARENVSASPYLRCISKITYRIVPTRFIRGIRELKSSIYVLRFLSRRLNMTYNIDMWLPIPLAVRSKAYVLGRPDCWSWGFECLWGHRCVPLVFVVCCVGSSLCDELIPRSEEALIGMLRHRTYGCKLNFIL
jgi:hypothetical protein